MTNVKTPCSQCPFSRKVEPGALGGSPPETYIGQAAGPFVLPCHHQCDFDDPQWKDKLGETPQCAGAAIFRSNIRVSKRMPASIYTLAQNHVDVFATSAEFLAHHKKIRVSDAVVQLKIETPDMLLEKQLSRASNRVVIMERPNAFK